MAIFRHLLNMKISLSDPLFYLLPLFLPLSSFPFLLSLYFSLFPSITILLSNSRLPSNSYISFTLSPPLFFVLFFTFCLFHFHFLFLLLCFLSSLPLSLSLLTFTLFLFSLSNFLSHRFYLSQDFSLFHFVSFSFSHFFFSSLYLVSLSLF